MCVQAAAVLTRTDVHWCETDSHTNEIMRLGLRDDGVHSPDFVRVEINPPKQDFRRPLSEWRFHTDQDIVPDWYEPKSAEAAVRDALPAWVAEHVILPGQYRDVITSGLVVAIYGSVDWIDGSARVDWIDDSARVDVITGAACTHAYSDAACSAKLEERGHIIDMRGDIPRIIVAAT